jgi:hypothetical protein
MTDEQWFTRALGQVHEAARSLPAVFTAWQDEERHHARIHGEAEGLRWCAVCQAFIGRKGEMDGEADHHPHVCLGVDHEETCVWCTVFTYVGDCIETHLEGHARDAGWRQCSACDGWYPPSGAADDHQSHHVGLYASECKECQALEGMATRLLEAYTYAHRERP